MGHDTQVRPASLPNRAEYGRVDELSEHIPRHDGLGLRAPAGPQSHGLLGENKSDQANARQGKGSREQTTAT